MQSNQDLLQKKWLGECGLCMATFISTSISPSPETWIKTRYEMNLKDGSWKQLNENKRSKNSAQITLIEKNQWLYARVELRMQCSQRENQKFDNEFNACLAGLYRLIQKGLKKHLKECKTPVFETNEIHNRSETEGFTHEINKQFVIFPPIPEKGNYPEICHIAVNHRRGNTTDAHFYSIDFKIQFLSGINTILEIQSTFLGISTIESKQKREVSIEHPANSMKWKFAESLFGLKWYPILRTNMKIRHTIAGSQHKRSIESPLNKLNSDLVHKISKRVEEVEIWEIDFKKLSLVILNWNQEFETILHDYPKFCIGALMCCARCGLMV
jgi:hypothetical protein